MASIVHRIKYKINPKYKKEYDKMMQDYKYNFMHKISVYREGI